MSRFVLTIAYNGENYAGLQTQPDQKTIQSEIEKTLHQVLGEKARISPSGRTDSGVHALSQTLHINLCTPKAIARIREKSFLFKMNAVLPPDIVIQDRKAVSVNFHARQSAIKKTYVYYLLISPHKNPFIEDKVWRITKPLDEQALKKAAHYLLGRHDFSAFCASDSTVKSKIREVQAIQITQRAPAAHFKLKGEKYLRMEFVGTGFLKQMVRNITGTLVRVGQGRLKPVDIKKILQSKDRKQASLTAPARGLYLKKVWY